MDIRDTHCRQMIGDHHMERSIKPLVDRILQGFILLDTTICYPLVNVCIAMENHYFHWVNQLSMGHVQWACKFTRGYYLSLLMIMIFNPLCGDRFQPTNRIRWDRIIFNGSSGISQGIQQWLKGDISAGQFCLLYIIGIHERPNDA